MTAPWMALAEADIGTKEVKGKAGDNPKILGYYAKVGRNDVAHDETAWCAAFVGSKLVDTGNAIPDSKLALLARAYEDVGAPLKEPKIGCIAVFPRGKGWQGHVGFVKGIDTESGTIALLGGNQRDSVSVETYKIADAIAWRWPTPVPAKPDPVKPVLPTAAASKSAWAQINAMLLVVLGYLTDLLQQGWEWAVWAVGALPVVVSGASPSINSGMQIAEWLGINWSKVAISTAVACMGVVLIRHIQDKRRVPWD